MGAVYITSPALQEPSLKVPSSPPCHKAPTTHFVFCWRLRCVRSERMGTDGSPLSPLIHQEPTASLACSVICLQATLLRKLPGSFSGPYAVLQSWPWRWPWDGQRNYGACAFQLQVSPHLPELDYSYLQPMALTKPAGFCESASCWTFKHQAQETKPLRTQGPTPWGKCGYSVSQGRKPQSSDLSDTGLNL